MQSLRYFNRFLGGKLFHVERVLFCLGAVVALCMVNSSYAVTFYEESTVYTGGDDGYAAFRLPVLIVEDDGTLLSFADGRVYSAADTGNKIDAVMKRSTDGGETWEDLQVLGTAGGTYSKVGNCTAVYDSTTDTTHLVYLEDLTHAYQVSTTDGGATFSTPTEITSVYDEFGFDWSYFATGHVHGIQLENSEESGRLVLPIWMSDHPRNQDSLATFAAGVIYSDDHGLTWNAGGLVDSDKKLNESTIFETMTGGICINSRAASGDGYRVVSWSNDAGESFGLPENDLELPDVVCQSTTLTTQDNQGVPVTLFCGPGGPSRTNLTVRVSYDDGQTWPISKVVAPNYSGYSTSGSTRTVRSLLPMKPVPRTRSATSTFCDSIWSGSSHRLAILQAKEGGFTAPSSTLPKGPSAATIQAPIFPMRRGAAIKDK